MHVQQQQQQAASENLSGVEMVTKSVSTLQGAGFSQEQSLDLVKAISSLITAEMKPFMDKIDNRLKAMDKANGVRFAAIEKRLELVERKVDGLQKALVGSVIGLAIVFLSAVAVILSVAAIP